MNIISPVTGKDSTKHKLTIPVSDIVAQYKKLKMDVSNYFEGLESIEIRECSATGYKFYYPFKVFGDAKFYEDLQKGYGEYYSGKWEHFQAMKWINADYKVLEVGSGTGFFLNLLKDQHVNAIGLELNKQAVEDGIRNGVKIENILLENYSHENKEQFDVVCSFEVLEHIADVKKYFENCLETLKKNGKIIIGVPNNNPFIYKYDVMHTLNLPPHHAGLWSKEAFQNLEKVFPIKLKEVVVESLTGYKEWYHAHLNYYKKNNKVLSFIMKLVPRPIYKFVLKIFRNKIEGRTIVALFEKL